MASKLQFNVTMSLYLLIVLISSHTNSYALIINVPETFSTIQSGIDNAAAGDTVLVQPDTYVENIDFQGKNLTLASLTLTTGDQTYTDQTIINGDSISRVVKMSNNAVLAGFTITGGIINDAQCGSGVLV